MTIRMHVLMLLGATFVVDAVLADGRLPFTSYQSLKGQVVEVVYEDLRGDIWLATNEGLLRGHGTGFQEVLAAGDPVAGHAMSVIEFDGALWIGTADGVKSMSLPQLTYRITPAQLAVQQLRVWNLRVIRDGLYAATSRGAHRIDAGRVAATLLPGTATERVFDIAAWGSDGLVIATPGGLIHILDDRVERLPFEFPPMRRACLLNTDGSLWVGHRDPGGLYRITDGQVQRFTAADGLLGDEVNALYRDSSGAIWAALESGVGVFQGQRWTMLGSADGLPFTDIHAVIIDREQQLWLGSFGGGPLLLPTMAIRLFDTADGLPHPMVMGAARSAAGVLYVATPEGVHAQRGSRFERIGPPDIIHHIHIDRHDRLWIGAGLRLLNGEREWTTEHAIRGFAEDDGGVLVVTDGSVLRPTRSSIEPPQLAHAVTKLFAIVVDSSDRLIVSATGGIYRREGAEWARLSDAATKVLAMSADDTLWFASSGRLLSLDTRRVPGAVVSHGEVGTVYDIQCHGPDTVWVAGEGALLRIRDGQCSRFNRLDGLPSNQMRSVTADGPDHILVGTSHGLARVDTTRFHPCEVAPLVTLQKWGRGFNRASADSAQSFDRVIEAHAAGTRSAESVRYKTRLIGRDERWSNPSVENRWQLHDLPPGDYEFQVSATNERGISTSIPSRLVFAVTAGGPERWRTTWIVGGGLAALIAVIVVFAWRRRPATARVDSLERQTAGVAHEVNNLLTVINGLHDDLRMALPPTPECRVALQRIQQAAGQVAAVTGPLLSGGAQRHVGSLHRPHVLLNGATHLLQPCLSDGIELHTACTVDPDVRIAITPGQFHQVILNLALNACAAMSAGGRLQIDVTEQPHIASRPARSGDLGFVVLTVRDTGTGVRPEVAGTLFEPFVTTRSQLGGTGLGLATVRDIANACGGDVWCSSTPGDTRFHVAFPALADATCALPTTRGETVLLVEDHPHVQEVLHRGLQNLGYDVLASDSGHSALQIFDQYPATDLVVLDVDLPGLDGLSCLREMRNRRPAVRAVIITGHPQQAADLVGQPRTAVLPKPFKIAALARTLRSLGSVDGL